MKQYLKIDEDGYYIEPVIVPPKIINGEPVYDVSDDLIEERYEDGLYKPKWTGTEWIEGITQEELDEMRSQVPEEPKITLETLYAKLKSQEQDSQMLAQQVVDLEIQHLLGGL